MKYMLLIFNQERDQPPAGDPMAPSPFEICSLYSRNRDRAEMIAKLARAW